MASPLAGIVALTSLLGDSRDLIYNKILTPIVFFGLSWGGIKLTSVAIKTGHAKTLIISFAALYIGLILLLSGMGKGGINFGRADIAVFFGILLALGLLTVFIASPMLVFLAWAVVALIEVIIRRMAEYPRGVVLGISALFTAVVGFLSLFAKG